MKRKKGKWLATQDYGYRAVWELVNQDNAPAPVQAYLRNSSVNAAGALDLTATADQSITALILAGSVAVSGGAFAGVSLSGAGAAGENRIAMLVQAFIDGDGPLGIEADSINLLANDT